MLALLGGGEGAGPPTQVGRGGCRQGSSRCLPGACTPGSGRVKDDLHPAVLPPRPHELAGGEPRPRGGVLSRPGVLVLQGQLEPPWGR